MLQVTVTRKVYSPAYQVFEAVVQLHTPDGRFTPADAVHATEIAFGNRGGLVVQSTYNPETQEIDTKAYRVYPNSVRRVYPV